MMLSSVTSRITLLLVMCTIPVQATPIQVNPVPMSLQAVLCKKTTCTTSSGIQHTLELEDGLYRLELPVDPL